MKKPDPIKAARDIYSDLKRYDFEAYRLAIEHAEALTLNFGFFSPAVAAEVERSHVALACKLLKVPPGGAK
jgi:hypothetical protein